MGYFNYYVTVQNEHYCSGSDTILVFFDKPESLSKYRKILNLKIYPNPARDYINIRFLSANKGDVTLNIFNLEGKLILNRIISDLSPGKEIQINTSSFNQGIYFIQLYNKEKINNIKLVKE
jgi:hypothetical protein